MNKMDFEWHPTKNVLKPEDLSKNSAKTKRARPVKK